MANMNRELERYLRKRKSAGVSRREGPSWWESVMTKAKEEEVSEHLTPEETKKLEAMEEDIEEGDEELAKVQNMEHELEEKQEKRVGLYHQLASFFKRKHEEPEEYHEVPESDEVEEDFKRMASIQVKWLEQLPIRSKEAFKSSEDYEELMEILERRGVAKRKD